MGTVGNKQFYDRERSSREVGAATLEHGAVIAARVGDLLRGALQGDEQLPDLHLVLTLMGRVLVGRGTEVGLAGLKYDQELQDDDEPRRRRDLTDRELRTRAQSIRNTVAGAYGDAGLAVLGLTALYGPGSDALVNYSRNLVAALEKPELKLPPSGVEGLAFEPRAAAQSLKPLVERLGAALDDVAREKSEAATALIAKDKAIAEHDNIFGKFAAVFEQFALAAGLPEVAERIRPSEVSPGVLANTPQEPAVPADPAAPTTPKRPANEGLPDSDPFIT